MTETAAIDVAPLAIADAHDLAPLVAAYVQDMKRGAPRRPDDYYAETLLLDRTAELIGARIEGRLVGFAVFFDLPDAMTGFRVGNLEDLFVIHDARDRGVVRALVDALIQEGGRRDWRHIRWLVPEKTPVQDHIAERLGEPAGLRGFRIPIPRSGER